MIDGRAVKFKASAATPRNYRAMFGRDLLLDYQQMLDDAANENGFSMQTLTNFENFAYTMAKQADPTIPDTPDEWLETFDTFAIYSILPALVDLWMQSNTTTSVKKKQVPER